MTDDRLDSWKEIAAYLRRDVTTVQRWEKREGMPVHRHQHDRMGSVYAFRHELDAWSVQRRPLEPEPSDSAVVSDEGAAEPVVPLPQRHPWRTGVWAALVIVAAIVAWRTW